jgi:hypothetical protein
MTDRFTAAKQAWDNIAGPLILGVLQSAARNMQRNKGASASAETVRNGGAFLLAVDGRRLFFQYADCKIQVRESDSDKQPSREVEKAAPVETCTTEWVEKLVERFVRAG